MTNLTEDQWRVKLSPQAFKVLREKGTERAFTGEYDNHFEKGVYNCGGCDTPLYTSDLKFKSGCGWPAFYDSIPGALTTKTDTTFGMTRTEIMCKKCGGHLGHVFKGEEKPGLSPVRPWRSFFSNLKFPKWTLEDLQNRITTNVIFYQTNYIIISGIIVALFSLFTTPIALVVISVILFMWWFFFIYHTGDLYIRAINLRIRKNYVAIFLTVVTVALSFFSGSHSTFRASSSIASVVILFHSIFKSNELIKVRRITTEDDSSNQRWDPESITSAHKMNKQQDDEIESKRDRQKQIRNRIREKYGLN
eukprot:gene2182-2046_t